MGKKILIGSIITIAILTSVSFTSVVGYNSVKSNPDNNIIITDGHDFEYCKNYLFETIIEISNNPKVIELINSKNYNLFSTNSNIRYNNLYFFRRSSYKLSIKYLDLVYKKGLEIFDELSEENLLKLLNSADINKLEILDGLNEILINNDKLEERIYNLNIMNTNEVSIADFYDHPVICFLLFVLSIFFVSIFEIFFLSVMNIFERNGNYILWVLTLFAGYPFFMVGLIFWVLFFMYNCWWEPYFS